MTKTWTLALLILLMSCHELKADTGPTKGQFPLVGVLSEKQTYVDNRSQKRLIRFVLRDFGGQEPEGLCLRAVKNTLRIATRQRIDYEKLPYDTKGGPKIFSDSNPAGHSAEEFRFWAKHNPVSLCHSLGLAKANLAEPGNILLYSKGRCGFDPQWGHAEILIKEDHLACSDHCRFIRDSCEPDLILTPVLNCDAVEAQVSNRQMLKQMETFTAQN